MKNTIYQILEEENHVPVQYKDGEGGWTVEYKTYRLTDYIDHPLLIEYMETHGVVTVEQLVELQSSSWYDDVITELQEIQAKKEYERKFPYQSRGLKPSDFY